MEVNTDPGVYTYLRRSFERIPSSLAAGYENVTEAMAECGLSQDEILEVERVLTLTLTLTQVGSNSILIL